jgi:pantoate kinase
MAQTATKTNGNGTDEGATTQLRSGAQAAADTMRQTAERAAARLPDAVAGAQVAARDTQRVLEGMDNRALLVGTSFSLGLGVGLFVSGANRLLVALALAPAGAMVMTMIGREEPQTVD